MHIQKHIEMIFATRDTKCAAVSVAFMLIAAACAMLRILFFEDISDDLAYRFVLSPDAPFENPFGAERVTSLADAVTSQIDQWQSHSGRFLLHTITQMFAGVWGREAYSVATAFIILAVELMLWHFAMRRNNSFPLLWALTCIVMTNSYGIHLIRIMAYGINYLWPPLVVLPFMAVLRRAAGGDRFSLPQAVDFAILAFVTGSTQEAFAMPLSAVAFLVLCTLAMRRRLTPAYVAICGCLFAATALVAFAPGTLSRGSSLDIIGDLKSVLINGVITISSNYIQLLPALLLCLCVIVKRGWRALLALSPVEMGCFVLSILMIMVAHTQYHSALGVVFFSYPVTLACAASLLGKTPKRAAVAAIRATAIAVFSLYTAYQIYLIRDDYRYMRHNHEIVEAYMASPDGIVAYRPLEPHRLTAGYMYDFVSALQEGTWNNRMIQAAYGSQDKPVVLFNTRQIETLKHISDCDSLRISGSAGFFLLGSSYAVKPAGSQPQETIVITQETRQGRNPISRIIHGEDDTETSSTFKTHATLGNNQYKLIHTRYGDFYIIMNLGYCPVVSIDTARP